MKFISRLYTNLENLEIGILFSISIFVISFISILMINYFLNTKIPAHFVSAIVGGFFIGPLIFAKNI